MIEVLLAAPQLTVQDTGRRGRRHLGVPRCGMLDTLALQRANLLLGNPADAAGLEITFGPVRLRALADLHIVLMGTDLRATFLRATLQNDGEKRSSMAPLTPGFVHSWPAGTTLRLEAPPHGSGRTCLAIAGGIDVPVVLGSRSTDLANRFGGLDGRTVATGDRLPIGLSNVWPIPHQGLRQPAADGHLRIVPGPDYLELDEHAQQLLHTTSWRVTQSSNRMGLRLEGPQLDVAQSDSRLSFGVLPGQIQLPAGGQPIVLAADAQTTGGDPCIASVIGADLWQLAYLTPGTRVTFSDVDLATAQLLQQQQTAYLRQLAQQLARSSDPASQCAGNADPVERVDDIAAEMPS